MQQDRENTTKLLAPKLLVR